MEQDLLIDEVQRDCASSTKIVRAILGNCIDFQYIAEIVRIMAPVCTELSPSGAIKWLKKKIELDNLD